MVDIFDEVEEELRAERARYGSAVIAAGLVIVVAVASLQGWRWREARHELAAAGSYLAEMEQADGLRANDNGGRVAAADALRRGAGAWPEGYSVLASLRAAALLADSGNEPAAAAIWDGIAHDPEADPLFRDAATISWVQRQIGSADPSLLEDRLRPLIAAGNPWRPLALEAQGLLEMRVGRLVPAQEIFRQLAQDSAAPEGVRGRASGLLNRLGG